MASSLPLSLFRSNRWLIQFIINANFIQLGNTELELLRKVSAHNRDRNDLFRLNVYQSLCFRRNSLRNAQVDDSRSIYWFNLTWFMTNALSLWLILERLRVVECKFWFFHCSIFKAYNGSPQKMSAARPFLIFEGKYFDIRPIKLIKDAKCLPTPVSSSQCCIYGRFMLVTFAIYFLSRRRAH